MSLTPLAIVEFYCPTSTQRQQMEHALRSFLLQQSNVYVPPSVSIFDFNPSEGSLKKSSSEELPLYACFLAVPDGGCYGCLNFSSGFNSDYSISEQKNLAVQIAEHLLQLGLCNSICLPRGYIKKSLFGRFLLPVIVAPPDFAKLSALRYFGFLDEAKLEVVIRSLNDSAPVQRFIYEHWEDLVMECKSDARFWPVLTDKMRKKWRI